jgi:hypothetical protein
MFEYLTVSFARVCSLSNTHAMYTHSSQAQSMLYKFLRRLAEKECCQGNGTILARASKIRKSTLTVHIVQYLNILQHKYSYVHMVVGDDLNCLEIVTLGCSKFHFHR